MIALYYGVHHVLVHSLADTTSAYFLDVADFSRLPNLEEYLSKHASRRPILWVQISVFIGLSTTVLEKMELP